MATVTHGQSSAEEQIADACRRCDAAIAALREWMAGQSRQSGAGAARGSR